MRLVFACHCDVICARFRDHGHSPFTPMMPEAHKLSPDSVIEMLCQQGCKAVLQAIAEFEHGERPRGTECLSGDECRQVVAELKAIMAVYTH